MSLQRSIIARNEPCMEVFRTLQATYLSLIKRSDGFIASYDLTRPQFEVIAALGHTKGLTFKELTNRVRITKGTLTGVINRLEEMGFVVRAPSESDRRSTVATLTDQGESLFEEVFTGHVAYLKEYLDVLEPDERQELNRLLRRIQVASR